jgi:hypothetical protein
VAASYSEHVDHVVIHETPTVSLMAGEASEQTGSAFSVYEAYHANGAVAAARQFSASVRGKAESKPEMPNNQDERNAQSKNKVSIQPLSPENQRPHPLDYFFAYEFLTFHLFVPNLAEIRASSVSISTVKGIESGDIFYARVARSGHAVFKDEPEIFATELRKTFLMLRDKNAL